MSTKAQIAANRPNAQNSTGPRTDEGKARTRQNALRHGLCSGIPKMADETPEEIATLLATLREEHSPLGASEEILVHKMAEHFSLHSRQLPAHRTARLGRQRIRERTSHLP